MKFTLILFCGIIISFSIKANDSLKVRKIRFFVEPKAIFIVPLQSHTTNSFLNYSQEILWPLSSEKDYLHQKVSINFGISMGLSIRLGKHFTYEFSLVYDCYHVKATVRQTIRDLSGGYPSTYAKSYSDAGTYKSNGLFNAFYVGNGISYKNKHFILTNSLLFGTAYQGELASLLQSYANLYPFPYIFMSEHKIGYSLLKGMIEPYIGLSIMYNSLFENYSGNSNYTSYQLQSPHKYIMPFTSLRINF